MTMSFPDTASAACRHTDGRHGGDWPKSQRPAVVDLHSSRNKGPSMARAASAPVREMSPDYPSLTVSECVLTTATPRPTVTSEPRNTERHRMGDGNVSRRCPSTDRATTVKNPTSNAGPRSTASGDPGSDGPLVRRAAPLTSCSMTKARRRAM